VTDQRMLVTAAEQVCLGNYRPAPHVLVRGAGRHVEDADGRRFLDLSAGAAVSCVGNAHPRLVEAIAAQAGELMHSSNLFYNRRAIELAAALADRTVFDRIFFANSGTEANEALIKIARRYHFENGQPGRTRIVAMCNSFHGRSTGGVALTGQDKYRTGFGPLLPDVHHVPFADIAALRAALDERVAAVIIEPIQGDGGLHTAGDAYLREVRQACDEAGALLFFDEVQTGHGRTGRFLAREWSGVVPDACSMAKGVAGGFPIGVVAVRERLARALPPGSHASTFGGNPLACAAALAVLQIFDEERLVERAHESGLLLHRMLTELVADDSYPAAGGVRGRGLLAGLVLNGSVDTAALLAHLRGNGVILTVVGGNVVRFSPALNVTDLEMQEGVAALRDALAALA